MGGLRGRECAEVLHSSVHADLCAPLPLAGPVDTLVSGGIVARTASVRIILRRGRPAQIVPAVVGNIPIAMIDRWSPPPAGHVEPRQLMFGISATIDPDVSSILVSGSRGPWGAGAGARTLAPAKFSSLRVVAQQLAQARAGQSRTSFHGCLANEKRAAKRPLGGKRGFKADRSSAGGYARRTAGAGAGATGAACISEVRKGRKTGQ
jgi:hypothetical protein